MIIWDKIKEQNIDIHNQQCEIYCDRLKGSSEAFHIFKKNEKIPFIYLLQSALIFSQNEAIYSLAIWHSQTEENFIDVMNKKAKSIGMFDSIFSSSTGLRRQGYTTANDMVLMAYTFVKNYPELIEITSQKEFIYKNRKFLNTNKLLHKYPNKVLGLKTGNLVGIGANLLNYFTNKNRFYISVVLAAESRVASFQISEKLMQRVLHFV